MVDNGAGLEVNLVCPNQRINDPSCPTSVAGVGPDSPIFTGSRPFAITAGDFDEDGWPDVAAASRVDGLI